MTSQAKGFRQEPNGFAEKEETAATAAFPTSRGRLAPNYRPPPPYAARFASGLSTRTFRRRMAEVRIPPAAAAKLASAGIAIARAEGFEAHAKSMEARIRENGEQ